MTNLQRPFYKDYLGTDEKEYLEALRKAGINVEWIIIPLTNAIYQHGYDDGVEGNNVEAAYDEGFKHGQEAEVNARADAIERNRDF